MSAPLIDSVCSLVTQYMVISLLSYTATPTWQTAPVRTTMITEHTYHTELVGTLQCTSMQQELLDPPPSHVNLSTVYNEREGIRV